MIAVSDQGTAGSLAGAAVAEGKAADRVSQSFPDLDTVDLLAVCDLDVDALVGWQVLHELRLLAAGGIVPVIDLCLRMFGVFPPSEANLAQLPTLFDPRGL
ncbi:hypothetical protein BIZ71_gp45 [Gordonia phage Hedwig]|uniref:Uncharacterized protein n=1 Tax=Gordonia phage Hedwig TaxID=1887648 RepID=A0A1C9EHU0_9CAUD|nr:hypothetical protein BIZ71_gp45 [Gordonia phage Hedwig]AON97338.1 hypothetical protein SEA_HEDWIG_45 [Gordonia phage Hedwig]